MAIYKRYNTHRKKLNARIVVPIIIIAVVFILTVCLGFYLGEKADGSQPLYTGQVLENGDSEIVAPLSEKSICGEYVAPDQLRKFTATAEGVWASTWLYRDGAVLFATETDKMLGKQTKGLVPLDAFDIESGVLGLFEVSGIYSDAQIKGVITEYERSLISEFAAAGVDETVLVFKETTEENYRDALEFAKSADIAAVICVPYAMLKSQEFFSAAADTGMAVALLADGVSAEQLESDIGTYAFYFTKYNIRLVLSEKSGGLVDVLKKHTILNYQFYS